MYKWLSEALRSWFFPPPFCRREAEEPSSSRPRRKRRRPSTQFCLEDLDQEQAKRQKLGIVGTLTQGITSLIKLPSKLTTKYFQTEDQHAEATVESFSDISDTLADIQMEPASCVQISKADKKTSCHSSFHPDIEMVSDSQGVMACLRHDQAYSVRKNGKKNHNSLREDLQPWGPVSFRHWLEGSTLDTGKYLRKPPCTVEERVQQEEREKYKQLLEQEKEKKSKNSPTPIRAKHLDTYSSAHRSLTGRDGLSFQTPRNGVRRSIDPLHSKTDENSLVTVTERSLKSEKFVVHKKGNIKQPLANDLSEEISVKLSLGHERGSCRRCSLVETEEQKCRSVDKATEGFPALTEDMEREIANVLSRGEDDEILTSAFKLNITRRDIQTLKNHQWLNDVVINFYMNLLVERNKKKGFPDLYAFSTFFYPKLNSAGYNAVSRWTKEVDIFQRDMILVPIHAREHWALAVIDMRRETIKYFDSMGQNGYRICMRLLQYLQEESKSKRNLDINAASWTLYSVKPHEIPQQLNGSDCGIFACKYADFISRDKPIVFMQHHMPYYRKRMVWEILQQQLP